MDNNFETQKDSLDFLFTRLISCFQKPPPLAAEQDGASRRKCAFLRGECDQYPDYISRDSCSSLRIRSSMGGCVLKSPAKPPRNGLTIKRCAVEGLPPCMGMAFMV